MAAGIGVRWKRSFSHRCEQWYEQIIYVCNAFSEIFSLWPWLRYFPTSPVIETLSTSLEGCYSQLPQLLLSILLSLLKLFFSELKMSPCKGKTLHSQENNIVSKVLTFFENEAKSSSLSIPIKKEQER